ncbi:NASP-related protein sim3 isoform X1 [Primulina eburnea]|uniref:NASP-related protein sim3 isoform X1 n=1 Tax=Primulina eburnea TaxID=1245227 RepID=UPI003C6BF074
MAGESANSSAQGPATDENLNSVEATIESGVDFGGAESTCNNSNNMSNGESSAAVSVVEREKSLEYAEELMVRGSNAIKERDYAEATDCYSRALEIRVAHFGELAPECVNAYYKYGCALLRKAQEEADPLASMPKKEGVSQEDCDKDGSVKSSVNGGSSATSVSTIEHEGSTNCLDEVTVEVKNEEGDDESDTEDLADGDEDESDLDLAWKMLDVSRAIVEKHCGDTLEKVDILSALAEVALEREDVETSLSDYLKSLSILERLVQPDSRLIAELNFRVCLCLEIGSKPVEAVPYCQKAISVCKSRLQRLTNEVKLCQVDAKTSASSESRELVPPSSDTSHSCDPIADKESEIDTLTDLCDELEKKLEDLQQLASNPKSILSDILEMMSAKANAGEKSAVSVAMNSSQMGIAINTGGITESPTVSTAHSNNTSGVTHLGVVGRGVKRVVMSSTTESGPTKKPSVDPSSNNSDGSAS